MILVEAALNIIFLSANFVEPNDSSFEAAIDDYNDILDYTENQTQLKEVIKLDRDYCLPIPVAVSTYEKLLTFNPTNSELLRNYAEYIELLIPDWQDYADSLMQKANELDQNNK